MKIEGLPRELIALRASKEIKDGNYVNLGIGIPTLISNWIEGRDVTLQSEIGMLKTGPLAQPDEADQDLINASCQPVTMLNGTCCFDILQSFGMIRGGCMDVVVMGAYQVNAMGDYAGWSNPDRGLDLVGTIGGSMDLCAGAKKLIITMMHTTSEGKPKIVNELTYPATAKGVVDLIITDIAVLEIAPEGLVLKEILPGLSPETVQAATEPRLIIPSDVKEMDL